MSVFSAPLAIEAPKETSWYQCVDWPDGSETLGKWDYRRDGGRDYLGRLDYAGKSVIEIGPASGYLTKQMSRQGATVTCIEVSDDEPWQVVPRKDVDADAFRSQRQGGVDRFRKAWWLTQKRWNTNARIAYVGVTGLDRLGSEHFDIALVASVLQHIENPIRALYSIAARADTVVVSDLLFPRVERVQGSARFLPARGNDIIGSWWQLSSGLVQQVMETAGFNLVDHYQAPYIQRGANAQKERLFYSSIFRRAQTNVAQPRLNNPPITDAQ